MELRRQLSDKQLQMPFFKQAFNSLVNAGTCRDYLLVRLNQRHNSGRQTRSEIYETLEKLAAPLLTRLDLATGVMGWSGRTGKLILCSQTRLAKEAGISPSVLSRFFALMEEAGYVRRRISKISKRQQQLTWTVTTEVLIAFTPVFFRHLGVGHAWQRISRWAGKRRKRQLAELRSQQSQKASLQTSQMLKNAQKKKAFGKWHTKQLEDAAVLQRLELARLISRLARDNPELAREQIVQMAQALSKAQSA